jgi:hypothetical protein
MRVIFRSFFFELILSVIGLWSGLFGYTKEKFVFFCDFVVDCVAQAFVLLKSKIPIALVRSQLAMRSYFRKFKGLASAVLSVNGFTHKLAVNAFA